MTKHDLAARAVEDALKEARHVVLCLEKARIEVIRRQYPAAISLVVDANHTASALGVTDLRNAKTGLEDCLQ